MPTSRQQHALSRRLHNAGVLVLAFTAVTCRDGGPAGPGLPGQARVAVAPRFQRAAASGGPSFVSLEKVIGTLTPVGGGTAYVIESPFVRDTAVLSFDVTFAGPTQQYTLALAATDTAGDTLFKSTRDVVASPGSNEPVHDLLEYVAPDTAVRFLSLSLSDTALLSDDSLALTAIGYDSRERQITPLYVGWTSRDSLVAKVASRGPSSARVFGGAAESDIWVVARAFNGAVDSVLVPVRLRVASVLLSADTLRMTTGDVTTLTADVRSASGASLTRSVTWQSLDTTVATVVGYVGGVVQGLRVSGGTATVALGQVAGVRAGATKIVATSAGRSDTTAVIVAAVPVASIALAPDTLILLVAEQARFSATPLDANGNPLFGRSVSWNTSDALVATVGVDGTVSGIGVGLATVSATAEGVTATAAIRVSAPANAIARTSISPKIVQLSSLGEQLQLVATSYAPDSTRVPGSYRYAVSGATGILSVDSFGLVTALGVGTANVIVSEAGGTSDTAAISVVQVAKSMRLTPPIQLDAIGLSVVFHASVFDGAGKPIPGAPLTWAVRDATVGQIVDAGGDSLVVQSVGVGVTSIDATSGGITGSTQLTVAQVPKSVTIAPNAIVLGIDGRAKLTASLFDENGSPMTFSQKDAQWGIEGSGGIAEVDTAGEVHAKAFGVAGVYAVVQGIRSSTASVNVSDAAPRAILFSADTLTAGSNGSPVSVYLTLATTATVTVTLADPLGLVKFDRDTLVFDKGLTQASVTIFGLTDGRTTIVASDEGKVFAPDSMTVFVGKGGVIAVDSVPKSPPPPARQAAVVTTALGSQTVTVGPTTGAVTRDAQRSPARRKRAPRATPVRIDSRRDSL